MDDRSGFQPVEYSQQDCALKLAKETSMHHLHIDRFRQSIAIFNLAL
jgi:hypothetical protein